MMNILQFKLGGEYDCNVTFETGFEKRKVQTNEAPKGDLNSAVSNVVVAAVNYFRLENISASFRQITFSYPENGPGGYVLELAVKTKENIYVKHILKSERLDLRADETGTTNRDFSILIGQQNTLVEKILTLREEIESYALGARMQQDLPFTDEEGSEEEASLFDDGEDDTGEEESGDEQQRRRSELHIVENGGEE
jgi:hypothetical protein